MDKWDILHGYIHENVYKAIMDMDKHGYLEKVEVPAFHYTSFENCMNMLEFKGKFDRYGDSPYLELFASHIGFMNDIEEFTNGLVIIGNVLSKVKSSFKEWHKNTGVQDVICEFLRIFGIINNRPLIPLESSPPHFVVSFCNAGNDLSQWKHYGKNCGVAIEYNIHECVFGNFVYRDEEFTGTERGLETYREHPAYSVIYEEKAKEDRIKKILEQLEKLTNKGAEKNVSTKAQVVLQQAVVAASFMKSHHYSAESEIRMMFVPFAFSETGDLTTVSMPRLASKVFYRERTGLIVPYLKIRLKHKDDKKHERHSPIKSLTIGPGQNQQQIFNALVMCVLSKFYDFKGETNLETKHSDDDCEYVIVNGIEVRRSLVPFRG
jgi:hypothetical protein